MAARKPKAAPIDEEVEAEVKPTRGNSKRSELNLVKHTETIDRLLLQKRELEKELDSADSEIFDLEDKLNDHSVKISKNLFYMFLLTILIAGYFINGHLINVNSKLIEINVVLQDLKDKSKKNKNDIGE